MGIGNTLGRPSLWSPVNVSERGRGDTRGFRTHGYPHRLWPKISGEGEAQTRPDPGPLLAPVSDSPIGQLLLVELHDGCRHWLFNQMRPTPVTLLPCAGPPNLTSTSKSLSSPRYRQWHPQSLLVRHASSSVLGSPWSCFFSGKKRRKASYCRTTWPTGPRHRSLSRHHPSSLRFRPPIAGKKTIFQPLWYCRRRRHSHFPHLGLTRSPCETSL